MVELGTLEGEKVSRMDVWGVMRLPWSVGNCRRDSPREKILFSVTSLHRGFVSRLN
jgi:hypothetical protein